MWKLNDFDKSLVRAATEVIETWDQPPNHTVAAAGADASGTIITGVNLFHFLGGPCAEVTVMARAASETKEPLIKMVAVADSGRGVLAPCGKCRQVMLDFYPDIEVIVPTENGPRLERVASLLPNSNEPADTKRVAKPFLSLNEVHKNAVLSGVKRATTQRGSFALGEQQFADLSDEQAQTEGVASADELRSLLINNYYPDITDDEQLSFIEFALVPPLEPTAALAHSSSTL